MQKTVSLVLVCGIQDYVRTNVKFLFLLVYCLLVLSTYDSVLLNTCLFDHQNGLIMLLVHPLVSENVFCWSNIQYSCATQRCRQTFVSWRTTGTSRDLSLPRLTAAEFLLQTSRRTRQHRRAGTVGTDDGAFWLQSQNVAKRCVDLTNTGHGEQHATRQSGKNLCNYVFPCDIVKILNFVCVMN